MRFQHKPLLLSPLRMLRLYHIFSLNITTFLPTSFSFPCPFRPHQVFLLLFLIPPKGFTHHLFPFPSPLPKTNPLRPQLSPPSGTPLLAMLKLLLVAAPRGDSPPPRPLISRLPPLSHGGPALDSPNGSLFLGAVSAVDLFAAFTAFGTVPSRLPCFFPPPSGKWPSFFSPSVKPRARKLTGTLPLLVSLDEGLFQMRSLYLRLCRNR